MSEETKVNETAETANQEVMENIVSVKKGYRQRHDC